MEWLESLFNTIMVGFKHEVSIYGYDISLWDVFMFTLVAGLVAHFVGELIDYD